MFSPISSLQDDEAHVSYDVDSLFTNIPIEETINYITEQIHLHKNLAPICSKLISRRLVIKIPTECTYKFKSRFLKQVTGFTMGGRQSVTFSDIYMVKIENRFVDGINSRQNVGDNDLFDQLNNYHPNIKLTIEINPSKFLDTN